MAELPPHVPQDAHWERNAWRAGAGVIAVACATCGAIFAGIVLLAGRVFGWWGGCV